MRKFVPLSYFSGLYQNETSLMDSALRAKFINRVQGSDGEECIEKYTLTGDDLQRFIDELQDPKTIVFHGWIERNYALKNLLTGGDPVELKNSGDLLNHQLSENFKQFISPYLGPHLLEKDTEDFKKLRILFSYVCLLETETRGVVENHLFRTIQKKLEKLTVDIHSLQEEDELYSKVNELCSDEVIYCINALSREMYASKVFFVESLLKTIKSGACTTRLANWIFKRLELLSLNPEHKDKIEDLKRDLKSGRIHIRNHNSTRRVPLATGKIITLFAGIALIGFVVFLVVFKDWTKNTVQEVKPNSSFKQFTKEERLELDSLLKDLRAKRIAKDYDVDTTATGQIIMPSYYAMRRGFLNNRLEETYNDWNKDGLLHQVNPSVNCADSNEVKFTRSKDEKELSAKTGSMKAYFINESDYSVILYVAKNRSGETVYSEMVAKGQSATVLLDEGDVILCVAGKVYSPFTVQKGVAQDLLPSFSFRHHFCNTDHNYLESMNTPYEVRSDKRSETRLIIDGDQNDYFQIVDLNHVIEQY